jgi:hypothetical protein
MRARRGDSLRGFPAGDIRMTCNHRFRRTARAAVLTTAWGIAATLGTPTTAQADDEGGYFIEARAGASLVDEGFLDETALALQLAGGFRWQTCGIEAGYLHNDTVGTTLDLRPVDGPFSKTELDIDGFFVGLNARTNVADRWALHARGGVLAWNVDVFGRFCGTAGCEQATRGIDGTDFYAGFGATYRVDERWSIGAAFDFFRVGILESVVPPEGFTSSDIDLDVKSLSLTTQYSF